LIELENDFGEEDVEFADRSKLVTLVETIRSSIGVLKDSFAQGNAIKRGIPVAIVGKPNVGKSTLLNALLNEDKAIISDIPGTTRDVIEDTIQLDGVLFRFMDTAGIRDTDDVIEGLGIDKTMAHMAKAQIVLYMTEIEEDHNQIVADFKEHMTKEKDSIILLNKSDAFHTCHSYDVEEATSTLIGRKPVIAISAKEEVGLDRLKEELIRLSKKITGDTNQVTVSNIRHYESLLNADRALENVLNGLNNQIPSDLVATDIRDALYHLGLISGEISTDNLLESIFSNFCIGK